MSNVIAWIAAEAERTEIEAVVGLPRRGRELNGETEEEKSSAEHLSVEQRPAQQSPTVDKVGAEVEQPSWYARQAAEEDRERERRTYRGRTVGMLRRYMRYSIETGRLPSLLGREFFRAKVTAYTVVTFEDRVIFVHDMEKCLERLDEFSRQLIARHILQEHDRWATAKLLGCNEKTVRRCMPVVLDVLSEILIEVGLIERLDSIPRNSCQGGKSDPFDASDCDDGEYKV